jgi:hypothetical protein
VRAGESGPLIAVSGHVRRIADTGAGAVVHLVCSTRLAGYDTFLSGLVTLAGGQEVKVRILTFDDVTVLLALQQLDGWADGQTWSGTLRLPRTARKPALPDDLAVALAAAGLEAGSCDPAELTHLLTWLTEAADARLRRQRLEVIVASLASAARSGPPDGGAS